MGYTELQVTSNFSFLRGASHPEELVEQAAGLGYRSMAITDRNSFAGVVRAHIAARKHELRLIPACRLDLRDGPSLLAYPEDRDAYGNLSSLLTRGNLRAEKGECHLYKEAIYAANKGLRLIVVPPVRLTPGFELERSYQEQVMEYREALGPELCLGATRDYQGNDEKKLFRIAQLAARLDMPMVALGDVHYHEPARRELQDVLTCIREKCSIQNAGFKLHQHAERYLKPPVEMERLFRRYPGAIRHTQEIAEACHFSLDDLKYVYPEELTSEGRTPQEELAFLTWAGARRQFGADIPEQIRKTIGEELVFIERKNYASYFLTVYDYVRFARERHILCQGRGSAANSVVCFCLGITSVNPAKFKLLFARFMSEARNEPPDIDVDFEHERREEVIQYIYEKYGRDRAAIVATVTQERQKGAIRDVGKAMGLSLDAIGRLSAAIGGYWDEGIDENRLAEHGFNPHDGQLKKVVELTGQLMGFPRQLGQHTGGFVITQGKLHSLCPILNARMEDRTCLEWNKDDLEALGFLKVDVLGLGMLTCIRKAFDLVRQHYGLELTLAGIPQDDPAVYEMISHADTLGVFQIESRAQMSMLPRLRPKCFYDLVIEVAIVRPGPIQGDMVHPYLRRRNGEEPVEYPSEEIKDILERTLGVPLFQEQAMEIAIVAAGFTPDEADQLRRSMATFKAKGEVSRFREKMIKGMTARGYTEEFAGRVFRQLEGFGSYGFPESHAASFALLVYISCWLKCYYPDVFAAALLNSQPMGFYQPAQIVADARKHGVTVLPADVNYSVWDNTLEALPEQLAPDDPRCALRLGFRQIKGMQEEDAGALIAGRGQSAAGDQQAAGEVERAAERLRYRTVADLCNAGVSQSALEILAGADAFRSLGLDRRQALWEAAALPARPVALFKGQSPACRAEKQVKLPLMSAGEHVLQDYASTSLSLKAHPVSFLREKLDLLHVVPVSRLNDMKDGMSVKVCGLVTVRQRPGTAKGVLFVTIEDESGFANLVVWGDIFHKYRKEIIGARLLMVSGKLQVEGEVIHVIVNRCFDLTKMLRQLAARPASEMYTQPPARPAIRLENQPPSEAAVFHKGRNFM